MPKINNLTKFILGFILSYIIISGLHFVEPVKKVHISVFNTFEQLVFNMFHPTVRTDFRHYDGPPNTQPGGENYEFSVYIFKKEQWRKFLANPNTQPNFILNQTAKLTSIGPITLFLSLLLVTPIGWRRKLVALLIGSFIIFIFIALKYSYTFQENGGLTTGAFSLWGGLSNVLGKAFRTHEFMLLCVTAIWAMVSLKKEDYKWFLK